MSQEFSKTSLYLNFNISTRGIITKSEKFAYITYLVTDKIRIQARAVRIKIHKPYTVHYVMLESC